VFNAKNLLLTDYDPDDDGKVDSWITRVRAAIQCDELAIGMTWPTRLLYYAVGQRLRGNASSWWQFYERAAREDPTKQTVEALLFELRLRYGTRLSKADATIREIKREKEVNETFAEYGRAL
jgi:hypothetical protein